MKNNMRKPPIHLVKSQLSCYDQSSKPASQKHTKNNNRIKDRRQESRKMWREKLFGPQVSCYFHLSIIRSSVISPPSTTTNIYFFVAPRPVEAGRRPITQCSVFFSLPAAECSRYTTYALTVEGIFYDHSALLQITAAEHTQCI